MTDAIFDPDGPDATETTEWVSTVVKEDASGLIRELRVDADLPMDDAESVRIAVEIFQLAMDRLPDRAIADFRRLMRLMEKYDDAASALTMFLMFRR